jgi:hypothetical protein
MLTAVRFCGGAPAANVAATTRIDNDRIDVKLVTAASRSQRG